MLAYATKCDIHKLPGPMFTSPVPLPIFQPILYQCRPAGQARQVSVKVTGWAVLGGKRREEMKTGQRPHWDTLAVDHSKS